ncbi:hypothetical protein DL95DRAFT_447459 [Leptodontidium sp. 2 PMI_412]|nr:hypothetical protein DL95DRAFT_447459 [Leptodontidium sp. 2 PMI_412]
MPNKHNDVPKSESRGPDCRDCREIYSKRHKHPRRGIYCKKHLCPVIGDDGLPCATKKSKHLERCENHALPPPPPTCNTEGCELAKFGANQHCYKHSCTFPRCTNYARPGIGNDYCEIHKCSEPSCQFIRKRNETADDLALAIFCRPHECMTTNCPAKKVPGKKHCDQHCCTTQKCPEARHPQLPGSFCLTHHNDSVAAHAISQREAELEAAEKEREKEQEKAHREAESEARYLRREREAQLKAQEAEALRLQEEENRRWEAEKARHGSQRQYEKSPRSSGSSFYDNGHLKPPTSTEKQDGRSTHYYDEKYSRVPKTNREEFVYVEREDDEAYHSASNATEGDRKRESGSSSGSGGASTGRGGGRKGEDVYVAADGKEYYFDERRKEKTSRSARDRAFETEKDEKDGRGW